MARLIRGFDASALEPRVVGEARQHAARLIAEAEERAKALTVEAEARANAIRKAAREEGKAEAVAEAAATLATARAERSKAIAEAEREVVLLAVAVARRLLRRTIDDDSSLVLQFAREAIERAQGARPLRLHVAPADHETASLWADANSTAITVEVDDALEPGDCLVSLDAGRIDARLATKLASLRDAMLRELEREQR